jgi:hypothetical protein
MNFNNLNRIISEDSGWKSLTRVDEAVPGQGVEGSLNVQKLSQYLPSQNPMKLKTIISIVGRGGKLNNIQLMSLGSAFIDILKANPQETIQIMNLIKRVAAEPEAAEAPNAVSQSVAQPVR